MKREYKTPKLTVHGSIESLTQAMGRDSISDTIISNGEPLNIDTDGSGDVVIP